MAPNREIRISDCEQDKCDNNGDNEDDDYDDDDLVRTRLITMNPNYAVALW